MKDFELKVSEYIRRHSLLRPEGKVVVAISGGADSVALLAVLTALGYDCVGAHCNFHLRGEESARDMRFTEDIAARLEVDLYVKDFDVAARQRLTGESLEMACRELRYKWFYDLLDRDYSQAIAVGHHREDQVETFFLNLLRGSGVTGLAAMRPRNGHVVRPLLEVSRAEIEDYLKKRGLSWIKDSSNDSTAFARNRLRNIVIPTLEQEFPGAVEGILRSVGHLRENEDIYTKAIPLMLTPYMLADGSIDLASLGQLEGSRGATLLFEALRPEGFTRQQTDDMLACASRHGGSFLAHRNHLRDVDHGILRPAHNADPVPNDVVEVNLIREIFHPIHIRITHHHISEFRPERSPRVAYLDERVLSGKHQFTLRHWRRGDRMTPFGMNSDKLLSDIFASHHLSGCDKEQIWLLRRDDTILWAVGLRASAHFAIGPSTKNFLRLEVL